MLIHSFIAFFQPFFVSRAMRVTQIYQYRSWCQCRIKYQLIYPCTCCRQSDVVLWLIPTSLLNLHVESTANKGDSIYGYLYASVSKLHFNCSLLFIWKISYAIMLHGNPAIPKESHMTTCHLMTLSCRKCIA